MRRSLRRVDQEPSQVARYIAYALVRSSQFRRLTPNPPLLTDQATRPMPTPHRGYSPRCREDSRLAGDIDPSADCWTSPLRRPTSPVQPAEFCRPDPRTRSGCSGEQSSPDAVLTNGFSRSNASASATTLRHQADPAQHRRTFSRSDSICQSTARAAVVGRRNVISLRGSARPRCRPARESRPAACAG